MRSLRVAAVAGLSALAMTLGTTTIASAHNHETVTQGEHKIPVEDHTPAHKKETTGLGSAGASSHLGTIDELEADQPANGVAIFGSSKDFDDVPNWAKLLYGTTVLGAIATALGIIVGPIHNFIVHGPQA
ncbi:hypothetical protein [Corynebacterium comes]|uniref:Or membrane protein n=1 Tax=Corynebacterium comes TaxID=2675218 RepID=A0A6B8W944_9CORY|nr:hypothetical protein [Corynebacterium comes]QGU03518.1 hypothetical protein CETAM_01125 [Corynebacterium comes]